MNDKIAISIWGLIKNNNGKFKSEKQRDFLRQQLNNCDDCFCFSSEGSPIYAYHDELGITKVIKVPIKSHKQILMFERKIEGQLTSLQIKDKKLIERKLLNHLEHIRDVKISFENGTYSSTFPYTEIH